MGVSSVEIKFTDRLNTDEHAERVASELQEGAQKFFSKAGREQTNASLDAGLDLDVVPTGEFYELARSDDEPLYFEVERCSKVQEEALPTFRGPYLCFMVRRIETDQESLQSIRNKFFQGAEWVKVGVFDPYNPERRAREWGSVKILGTRYGEVTLHRTTFEVDWNDENAVVNNDRESGQLKLAEQEFERLAKAVRAHVSNTGPENYGMKKTYAENVPGYVAPRRTLMSRLRGKKK